MSEKEIKLSTRPEPAPQPQVVFPFMNIQIAPQGIVITTHFTPVSAFTQVLDRDTIKKILPQLKEMLRNEKNELALIRHINESRIN